MFLHRQTASRRAPRIISVASIVLAIAILPMVALASDSFTDVPDSHPFHDQIGAIKDAGITTGCTPTTYCPNDNVTRGQMAAFMHRGYGRVAFNNVQGTALNLGSDGQFATELTTSMQAGAVGSGNGLVLVQANLAAYTFAPANCPCQIEIRIRNATTTDAGPVSFAFVGNAADPDGLAMGSGSVSAVFELPAGQTHTYEFQAVVDDDNGSLSAYINMWAEYIPFDGTGGSTAATMVQGAPGSTTPSE